MKLHVYFYNKFIKSYPKITELYQQLITKLVLIKYKKTLTWATFLLLPAALASIAFTVFCGGGWGICTVAALKLKYGYHLTNHMYIQIKADHKTDINSYNWLHRSCRNLKKNVDHSLNCRLQTAV